MGIQLKYIERFTREPFRIFSYSTDIDFSDLTEKFYFIEDTDIRSHFLKLDLLAEKIINDGNDDDIIIFIDGDAFPIADYVSYIKELIKKYQIIAIRRDENMDLLPHPCFCATTIGFWKKIKGTWKRGNFKVRENLIIYDVGGILCKKLEELNIDWYPLKRSNKKNYHPLFFGVYDDIIYHHGAGFREPIERIDSMKFSLVFRHFRRFRFLFRLPNLNHLVEKIYGNIVGKYYMRKNQKKFNKVNKSIITNEEFFEIFNI